MLRQLFCLLLLFGLNSTFAQEVWSLEKCVRHAQENNIDAKRTMLNVELAALDEKRNKMSRLPNLSARFDGNNNFGRTINPVTNQFVNQSLLTNQISLNTNIPIYQGGFIHNSIKRSQIDAQAAMADADAIKNNVALSIANAYLQVMFSEEQLNIARQQFQQTQDQLNQTNRLIKAGTLPVNDKFDIEATLAQNEQNIINQENTVAINYLALKQLLLLEPDYDLVIERPEIVVSLDEEGTQKDLGTVYQAALGSQPQILAGDLRMKSAELGIPIARSGMLPSLGIGGNLNTNYAKVTGVGVNNESYAKQLENNFGQSIGLSLNIPIYSRHTNTIAIERARIGVIDQELQNLNIKQQLKADIQRAIADARAAAKALQAAQKTIEARQIAYQNAEKRFKLGAINSFELTTSKNNYDQAQTNLLVAKYDYLFRLKIVDFYEGKTITLD